MQPSTSHERLEMEVIQKHKQANKVVCVLADFYTFSCVFKNDCNCDSCTIENILTSVTIIVILCTLHNVRIDCEEADRIV